MLLSLLVYVIPLESLLLQPVQAAEDIQGNDTRNDITNNSANWPSTANVIEEKFRTVPIVRIRSLSDVINKSSDGLIEIYLENPDSNDISLTAEINITVPSGINVYGQGFGDAQAAGVLYAKMGIPPGNVRIAYVNIKAEKTGNYFAQLNGTYYPGKNNDKHRSLSFTYPFVVQEPSPYPKEPALTNPKQIPGEDRNGWVHKIVLAIIVVFVAGLVGLGYKIVEIKRQYKLELKNRIARSKVANKDGKVTDSKTSETKTTEIK